jgi:proton-dependent oligopeptide transporter, POT family
MAAVSDAAGTDQAVLDTSGIAGHPKGLMTLFFTEMWERFSYYGMRAFLVLFMVTPVAAGGLGFEDGRAGAIYGLYTAMVYMLSVPGGWLADRFLGQQNAVLYGGILIMSGHISLAVPLEGSFFLGLALVALGTGLLKPNISSIVGQLYAQGDARRDAGFTIFYMGINLGAFLAPLICGGLLAESEGFRNMLASAGISPNAAWHFAFSAAAIGMAFGLVQYVIGRKNLRGAGKYPTPPADEKERSRNRLILFAVLGVFVVLPVLLAVFGSLGIINLTLKGIVDAFDILLPATAVVVLLGLYFFGATNTEERRRMLVVIILFFAAAVFWGCFEQAGSTLTLFAERNTDRLLGTYEVPTTSFQALNAVFVVLLAPVFAWLWIKLAKMRKEPATLVKFGMGMVGVGLGFLILLPAAYLVLAGSKAGMSWLVMLYLVHTCAELCLSPVGLSAMTKLAPARIVGLIMGVWFLAASMGNYMAGRVVALTESMRVDHFFLLMTAFPVVIGIILFILAKPVERMLARSDNPAPTGH